jgi:hypothetical protein
VFSTLIYDDVNVALDFIYFVDAWARAQAETETMTFFQFSNPKVFIRKVRNFHSILLPLQLPYFSNAPNLLLERPLNALGAFEKIARYKLLKKNF